MCKKENINKEAFVLNWSYNLKDIATYWDKSRSRVELHILSVLELKNFNNTFEKFLMPWMYADPKSNVKEELFKLEETVSPSPVENDKLKIFGVNPLNKRIKEILGIREVKLDLNKNKLKKKVNVTLSQRSTYIPLVTKLMSELRQSFLENRVRRYVYKHRLRLDWFTKTPRKWKSPITFYKRKKRYIKKRFRKFSRFKVAHWYFPSYVYFDARTLRAVFLHNPQPDEVRFSFKCSLPHVHAFYKGLGL